MHRTIFFLCVPLVCFLLISTSLYLGRDHITRLSETYLPLYAPNQVATTFTETISSPSSLSSSTSTSTSSTSIRSYTVYAEKVPSSTISSYTTTATISSTTTSATPIDSAIPIKNGGFSFAILVIQTNSHQALYSLPSASHLISTPSSIPHPKSAHD